MAFAPIDTDKMMVIRRTLPTTYAGYALPSTKYSSSCKYVSCKTWTQSTALNAQIYYLSTLFPTGHADWYHWQGSFVLRATHN